MKNLRYRDWISTHSFALASSNIADFSRARFGTIRKVDIKSDPWTRLKRQMFVP